MKEKEINNHDQEFLHKEPDTPNLMGPRETVYSMLSHLDDI